MISKLTEHNDIMQSAMQAAIVRNDVILNNIANVDTPGFKKRTVVFDDILANEVESAKLTGTLNLSNAKPQVRIAHQNFDYRIDENNVDIDIEMVDLYQNALRYETMANSVTNKYKRLNSAISPR